ncbi:hypothetical protein ACH4ZX_23170 [Streptomyces sp. NPDC020490]|uniref:hypothetical protein n=1 Tax=Streptomyces sp. NPDC020490 TaxID=3365078 RepID=UPI00379E0464
MTKTASVVPDFGDSMEVVGRTFVAALQEGLSRVAPPWTAPRPGVRGERPPAQAAYRILLRDHREAVLARLADALPAVLHAAGHPAGGRRTTAFLVDWARTRLTAAVTGPRPGVPEPALPSLHLELTVATLLLECASRVLPDVPSRALALEALGHALRTGSPTGRAA